MESVKREFGAEICRGCLTTDRRLSPLANYNLFFTLLNEEQKLEALKCPALLLCWECGARLRRMKLFQTQVQNAHRLLEEMVDELPVQGLSQLSISHKQEYDVVIEDELDYIEEIPIKEEETKVQTDTLELNFDQDDNHDYVGNDIFESHDGMIFTVETTDNYLEETINTPRKHSKRKLKRVRQPKNKTKRIKMTSSTNTKNKSNRAGLRSSREVIAPLYPLSKNNYNKKDVKSKNKVNNTIKRIGKKAKPKKPLNKKISQSINEVKKEKKTPDNSEVTTKDSRNELTIDVKEVNIDSDLDNAEKEYKNPIEEIEIVKSEQNDNLNDDDSKTDSENDDPDFEEELRKDTKRVKQKCVASDSWLHSVLLRFDINVELDEYFTKVDLSPEEVKDVLDNELSYTSEELRHGCHYCGLCFQLCRTLTKHKRERHKQMAKCKNPVYLMYRCNICHKIVRKEHTEAHMKYLHRYRYFCKECDKGFWYKEEGKTHYREAHKEPQRHKCGVCTKVTRSRRALETHVRYRHTPFPCDICNKTLPGLHYLQHHKRYRHDNQSNPEQRYCVTCDKQFESVLLYDMHVKNSLVHKRQPPERCPCTECGRVLHNKLSLEYHFQRFHGGKTNFYCPHCDKYFARKSGLKVHNKSAHLKQKPPKDKLCSICGRGFSYTRTLIHHVRTHTGERPHVCPHCPAAFAQPYPLQKHLATQHPEAPKAKD